MRTHDGQGSVVRCYVSQCGMGIRIAALGQSRDRQITLDSAAWVQHLSVNNGTRHTVHVRGGNAVQLGAGVATLDQGFSETRKVKKTNSTCH